MKVREVWVQSWVRCVRTEEEPGGFSLHTKKEHAGYFIKNYRNKLPSGHNGISESTPFYSPRGDPRKIEVSEVTFDQIPEKGFGAWFDQRPSPHGSPVWVLRHKP